MATQYSHYTNEELLRMWDFLDQALVNEEAYQRLSKAAENYPEFARFTYQECKDAIES